MFKRPRKKNLAWCQWCDSVMGTSSRGSKWMVCFEIKHLVIIMLEVLKHLALNLSGLHVWHFTLAKTAVFFKDLKDKIHTNFQNYKQRIRMTDYYRLKETVILGVHTKGSLLIWEGHAQVTIIKHCFSLLSSRKFSTKLQQAKRTAGSCIFQMGKTCALNHGWTCEEIL